jgi:beta-galactosidase
VGQHPSGYTGFRYNIGKFVHAGKSNTLAVFVDPRWFEGWWYEGGGIYRHVRLMITNKLHVAPWGTFVISKVPGAIHHSATDGDHAYAQLTIQTTVHNAHHTGRGFTLVSQIISPAGNVIATISTPEHLAAGQKATLTQHAVIGNAALWSLHHCNLYHLMTSLRVGRTVVDDKRTTFGIRTLRFDPNHGFFLNGKHVELQGTCNHQDFPAVGIAAADNLWKWRIAKLKALGSNAYRTAHNPLASAFYRACDHQGMLVMDENRHLGDVYSAKTPMGAPYSNFSDLKWMILAQRNDPCVIFWSLCNEEIYVEAKPYGVKVFKAMMRVIHQLDPTRPCTCAYCVFNPTHSYFGHGFMKVENILGCNYGTRFYPSLHREIPNKMIFGSENINTFSDRGVLRTSRKAGVVNEYGTGPRMWVQSGKPGLVGNRAPWHTLIPVMTHSFVAGEFVWTGFNYRGEPNPYSWPAVASQTGIMDLCGFPKAVYYYWHAWWRKKPSVYIFPAWTFPKSMIGKPILIRCYSNCRRVALFLNGKSLGTQVMPKYKYLDWTVPYAPGVLTARGYDGQKVVATCSNRTAGPAAALQLRDEVSSLTADGESIAPVEVKMIDAHGIMVPNAHQMVHFTVSGPGSIAGANNGNSASHESNVGHQVRVFHGLALVMIRAGRHPGVITLTATANGVSAGTLQIRTTAHPGGLVRP